MFITAIQVQTETDNWILLEGTGSGVICGLLPALLSAAIRFSWSINRDVCLVYVNPSVMAGAGTPTTPSGVITGLKRNRHCCYSAMPHTSPHIVVQRVMFGIQHIPCSKVDPKPAILTKLFMILCSFYLASIWIPPNMKWYQSPFSSPPAVLSLWSGGQSSWLQKGGVLFFLWGRTEFMLCSRK
jgi:hypothetical protein